LSILYTRITGSLLSLEDIRVAYTLAGDRNKEYAFLRKWLPRGTGNVLDIGPGEKAGASQIAIKKGYTVTGIDLCPIDFENKDLDFVLGDFLLHDLGGTQFNYILNISSMEHFGISGRYNVSADDPSADLKAMTKVRRLLLPGGKMFLTIPLGVEALFSPFHRVYGEARFSELLAGYRVDWEKSQFFDKIDNRDIYRPCDISKALLAQPTIHPSYYALGMFVLEVEE